MSATLQLGASNPELFLQDENQSRAQWQPGSLAGLVGTRSNPPTVDRFIYLQVLCLWVVSRAGDIAVQGGFSTVSKPCFLEDTVLMHE
jgi:hypothetical protein